MNRVVKILMERDDLTKDEALELINECKQELLTADPWEADDIIMSTLGLEPDYLFDIF